MFVRKKKNMNELNDREQLVKFLRTFADELENNDSNKLKKLEEENKRNECEIQALMKVLFYSLMVMGNPHVTYQHVNEVTHVMAEIISHFDKDGYEKQCCIKEFYKFYTNKEWED